MVEIATGLLSLGLLIRYNLSFQYFFLLFFSASLVAISFIDLQHQIIPDVISIPGILIGMAVSILSSNIKWHASLIGAVAGGGVLYLVAVVFEKLTGKEGMGGGDIKLLAMIGAWLGWKSIPFVLLISSFTGAVIGGGSLLLARSGLQAKIPFGPFLSLGALVYLFFGPELTVWYFSLI